MSDRTMKHCPVKDCLYWSCDDDFCPEHGKKLIDYPKCSSCERRLILAGLYCPKCGTKRPDNQERGK